MLVAVLDRNASEIRGYVNGVLRGTRALTDVETLHVFQSIRRIPPDNISIGGINSVHPSGPSNTFTGNVSNAIAFNRVLTPTEIQALYRNPLSMIDTGVELWSTGPIIEVPRQPQYNSTTHKTSNMVLPP